MTNNKFTFQTHYYWRSDPSHTWLQVPLQELHQLKIINTISHSSYFCDMRGYAYLADQDAEFFINHHPRADNWENPITFEDILWPEHNSHWIRRLDPISALQHNKDNKND